jgi:ATP-dependent Lon protease
LKDNLDIEQTEDLNDDHYDEKVKERVVEYLAVKTQKDTRSHTLFLVLRVLVRPPQAVIARALGRQFIRCLLACVMRRR